VAVFDGAVGNGALEGEGAGTKMFAATGGLRSWRRWCKMKMVQLRTRSESDMQGFSRAMLLAKRWRSISIFFA
jgi:hypothetical protein